MPSKKSSELNQGMIDQQLPLSDLELCLSESLAYLPTAMFLPILVFKMKQISEEFSS